MLGSEQDGLSIYMNDILVVGNQFSGCRSQNGVVYVDFGVSGIVIRNNIFKNNGVQNDGRTTYAIKLGSSG